MRNLLKNLPALLLSVATLALILSPGDWPAVAQAQRPIIRFGAALSLTGQFSDNGRLVKDGYDFYIRHVNQDLGGIDMGGTKYQVDLTYYDDQSDTTTATKLVEKLIAEDGVKFILGPYGSTITLPVSKVVERYRIPMVEAHGSATTIYEQGNRYVFGVLNTVDQYFPPILKMAMQADPKPRTMAVLYENLLFPQLSAETAVTVAKQLGLEVVYDEHYPSSIKDLSSELAVIRDKAPDIFLASGYIGDMILLARQADEIGVKPKLFGMSLGPTHPTFIPSLGRVANGVVEPAQWAPTMPWKDEIFGWTAAQYAVLFKREVGYDPDYHPPQSTAALEVFHRAIQKAGSLDPGKVRDAIAQIDIMTAYGPIKFNEKGENIAKSMAVIQIQNGKPVVVYPSGAAEKRFLYPRSY